MFTYELARRWNMTDATANVRRPGVMGTAAGHEDSARDNRAMVRLVAPF